jgi:hypothetical protein
MLLRSVTKMSKKKHPGRSILEHNKKDIIVAVRMPRGLVDELKDIQKINHFMDISEEIRFVIRKYCTQLYNIPTNTSFVDEKKKEKLIQDLTHILENLKTDNQTGGL